MDASSGDDPAIDLLMRRTAEADHLAPFLPGMIIGGKYRIEGKLGRGGMGAVYQATHVVSRKPVALKCMLRSAADENARARFIREAQAAACIDHPNVVNVYDVGQEDEYCFLVMELLHGETLGARLKRERLGIAEALDLLMPAMRGVSAIHRAGVIHRDLKPENIFLCVSPDGSQREAKVLDFGISALPAHSTDWSNLTADGALLGTPAYMSPEQVQSARDIDETTDIYSFGVILYEALAGQTPYAAQTPSQLVLDVVHTPPRSLRELRPELPVELECVVLRALEKARDKRHPSIDALIESLLPYTTRSEASVSNTQPTSPVGARAARRVSPGVLLAAAAIAALTGIAVVAARMDTQEQAPGTRGVAEVSTLPISLLEPERDEVAARAGSPALADAALPLSAAGTIEAMLEQPPLQAAGVPEQDAGLQNKPEPKPVTAASLKPRAIPKSPAQPKCDLDFSIDPSGRKIYRSECRP